VVGSSIQPAKLCFLKPAHPLRQARSEPRAPGTQPRTTSRGGLCRQCRACWASAAVFWL